MRTISNTGMKSPIILIFDHEEAVRESLQLVLSEEGFTCYLANTDQDALQLLNTNKVDMTILDSKVVETTRVLQNIKETYPQIKIIVLSSYSEFEVTQKALTEGADNYALKPLDFDELIALINRTLSIPNDD